MTQTTAKYREMAWDAKERGEWTKAAKYYALALKHYPPHKPGSQIAIADKAKLQQLIDEMQREAQTAAKPAAKPKATPRVQRVFIKGDAKKVERGNVSWRANEGNTVARFKSWNDARMIDGGLYQHRIYQGVPFTQEELGIHYPELKRYTGLTKAKIGSAKVAFKDVQNPLTVQYQGYTYMVAPTIPEDRAQRLPLSMTKPKLTAEQRRYLDAHKKEDVAGCYHELEFFQVGIEEAIREAKHLQKQGERVQISEFAPVGDIPVYTVQTLVCRSPEQSPKTQPVARKPATRTTQLTESQQAEQILIQQSIENETHNGYVKGKTYHTLAGDKIKFGDYIRLNFMGAPANMVTPLKLVSARNCYSTVGYNNNVKIVVKDKNGVEYTFEDAHIYSPRKDSPAEHAERLREQHAHEERVTRQLEKNRERRRSHGKTKHIEKPAPNLPPILTAPPELAADVLGGLTPTVAPKPKRKPAARKPAPNLPPILTAPPELTADVLGTGPMGLPPTAAPGRKPAARTTKPKAKKTTAAKTRKTTKKAAKPKAKKTAAAPKLTASQREYLAIQGFVMVKRGGKYVKITG